MRSAIVAAIATTWVLLCAGPAHAGTEEDAVRAVLDGMNGSYNRSDFSGFAAHLCADMRSADGFEAGWLRSRISDGPTRISVNSITVTTRPDVSAIANVRFIAAERDRTLDIEFRREGSQWKACRYVFGQAV